MKFTLKLQIDSATELAQFIQDMNMEIDLPFLDSSNSQIQEAAIKQLNQMILDHRETIEIQRSLIEKYENFHLSKEDVKTLSEIFIEPEPVLNPDHVDSVPESKQDQETIAEPDSEFAQTKDHSPVPESKQDQETIAEPDPDLAETKERVCLVCGKPVPPLKVKSYCSPKCYANDYAKKHYQSKKVKSPQKSPD